ncbi:LacI family DNA-binding transcriptional regulator [Nonomuraea lactucae]|uniref:LacI family DNA-binding transcriptional regulator n=1 Tax=Nonomuraea lactucae TaxID=2249762 RepID=UPI000DE359DC|nr:LacI family DNA-binding transcriptional regulator [Nonomuraea lactucae]
MADIAAQAGVSISTVSKVLHGRSDVSAKTRGKVQRLLGQHGYTLPGRHEQPGGLVEFVINELDNPWAVELIRGAEDALQAEGFGMVVSAVHRRSNLARRWLDNLTSRGSLGAILAISELSAEQERELGQLGIPFVEVQPSADQGPDVPSVGSTSWNGGFTATRHLIELGHRRIAMITGPAHRLTSRARLDGYRAALDQAGLEVDPTLIRHGDYSHEPSYQHALELLDRPDRPTAVFAGNDLQALGTYRAARRLGLRVPEDLSVVGFDDLPFAQWVAPTLTTVRQPLANMAAVAARMLVQLINGQEPETLRVELATSLVVRASTAPVSPHFPDRGQA